MPLNLNLNFDLGTLRVPEIIIIVLFIIDGVTSSQILCLFSVTLTWTLHFTPHPAQEMETLCSPSLFPTLQFQYYYFLLLFITLVFLSGRLQSSHDFGPVSNLPHGELLYFLP